MNQRNKITVLAALVAVLLPMVHALRQLVDALVKRAAEGDVQLLQAPTQGQHGQSAIDRRQDQG